ncbi:hypothetical protein ACFWJM_17615 [Streptomyces sp. NPDC127077]|uniref:hypothetical protein n=1 Tax=Streptomyces sp. NPDC127077 TaxID=3347131 RepID=UPI003661F7B5
MAARRGFRGGAHRSADGLLDAGGQANVLVPVPGWATVLLVLLQLVAAVVSSWLAWPAWVAVLVTVLAAATCVTERGRWQWLMGRAGRDGPAV